MEKKKIEELFGYRKLPYMLKALKKKNRKPILNKLIKLQDAIYKLDRYLESNWNLKEKTLGKYWKEIFRQLKKFNIDENEIKALTAHIRKYQLHETQLREGLLPTRLTLEYYYYYKSCDVRLMRVLLQKQQLKRPLPNLTDWRFFDLITEINDDIDDFKEDHKTINGNYFLIMVYTLGTKETHRIFTEFLNEIIKRSYKKNKSSKNYEIIHLWTKQVAKDTQTLLNKRTSKIEMKKLKIKKLKLSSYLDFEM